MNRFEKLFPYFLITGILLNANGLLNDILEPDGALYATIAKHIALTGDWINLFADGHDWLDKPHFPFWLAAASFKVFGITAFAYKLPAFLFWLAGACITYKFANDLYNSFTAKVAVIIYIFSLHNILNNFDVRAEPYLTTLSIGAIYFIYRAYVSTKWKYVVFAALMSACAVMTKGIFVLITIGGGFVIYWMITRQWKQFINFRWWLMVLLIFVFITPELYCLYSQFDLHPEKVVFGNTNVSGIRFFFWDSQFGRFFNTGPIKGHGDLTFFLHTTLWAFLPWSVILYIAVIQLFVRKEKTRNPINWIVYGSAAITFILFSLSKFQLPFYIVIIFPQFAMITAAYLTDLNKANTFSKLSVLQNTLVVIAALLVCVLAFYSKFGNSVFVIFIAAGLAIANFIFFKKEEITRIITSGIACMLILCLFLFNFFYPGLLQYQSGMMAGKWLTNQKRAETPAIFKDLSYSFEFYAPGFVKRSDSFEYLDKFIAKANKLSIYTSSKNLDELQRNGYSYTIIKGFSYFHVSMLTGKFLNPATRTDQLEKMVLITVKKKV